MTRKALILILLFGIFYNATGQSLQDLLEQVSRRNPEIEALRRLLEARKYEAKTGNAPSGPFISAGYMPGSPSSAGTMRVWSVTQSFDFPTKYLLQKKVNTNTVVLAEQEFNHGRLLTLLDAELTAFDLIYDEKSLIRLRSRKEGYDRLLSAWKKMLDHGETTILDYNKIMMELSDVTLRITRKEAEVAMIREKLKYMSGSEATLAGIKEYPVVGEPDLENILKEKAATHPEFLIPETEYMISLLEVKVSRTGSLPGFQVGYSSEIVPGETFTGPSAGLSIPLWANANKVKAASALADHSLVVKDAALMRLKSQVIKEYANMKALQKSISEVKEILLAGQGTRYPDIALSSGEISVTTYFSYLGVLYDSEDKLLELENEYQKSLAKLMDHELIKRYQ